MARKRIVFQNWIADLGFDPQDKDVGNPDSSEYWPEVSIEDLPTTSQAGVDQTNRGDGGRIDELREAVQKALDKLSENEREFICRFYFMGQSYREISEESGRAVYSLEALHGRAVKKLQKQLAAFVKKRFKVEIQDDRSCPICRSPHRLEIDGIIEQRDKTATWKPVMSRLCREFGIKVKSPQLLIGHQKYH